VARRRNSQKPIVAVGEVVLWLLFVALLIPAGLVGWAIGHYTNNGGTTTHTITVASPAPTTTAAAAPATTTAAATPTVDAKAIFTTAGCGACHTFKAAGASAKVGPDLDTAPAVDAKKANMPLAAFVKQSIVDPNAYIAPGFTKGLMPTTFGQTLSAAKIDALVFYITSGGK
jgi:cytochrome c551/c552